MDALKRKIRSRLRRKMRIRKKVFGTQKRPRLSVFRSSRHIYAQVIDDAERVTITAGSSLSPEIREKVVQCKGKIEVARLVGGLVARRALEKGVKFVTFDRGGYSYHGRVKALADGARESGLEF